MAYNLLMDRLQVTLTANKDVQHHEFTLEKPSRIVVDLFSSYAQQDYKRCK